MNKKGIFQMVPDLAWFFVLILFLAFAFVALSFQQNSIQDGVSGESVEWEVGWLANAMISQPFNSMDGKSLTEMGGQEITSTEAVDLEYEIRDYYLNRFSKVYGGDFVRRTDSLGIILVQNEEVLIQFRPGYGNEFIERGLTNLGAEIMTRNNQTAFFQDAESGTKGLAMVAGEHPITLIIGARNS